MGSSRVIHIEHLDLPDLAPYRDQKDAWLRARHHPQAAQAERTGTGLSDGLFLAEGELVVEQLICSSHEVVSMLVSEPKLERTKPLIDRLDPGVPVYVGPAEVVERIVGFHLHRGVLACGRARPVPLVASILERARVVVVLEDLTSHDNVGGIFRSVRALVGSEGAVLLTPRCCDPLYRRALRVSIGHALHVPYAWLTDWPVQIDQIAAAGFRVLALTPAPGATDLDSVATGGRCCLLAGAEGPGLSAEAMEHADERVRIRMDPAVDSLNVSVSVALALHAVRAGRPDPGGFGTRRDFG